MIRQCTVKPVWISHALKRRPCSDGQARLMLSVFYMLSFHAFLKRKTVKRTLIQTDNIFSPQIKNTLPYADTNENLEISINTELNWIFLTILSKRNIFYTLNNKNFSWFQFAVLKECNTFDSNSASFIPHCSLQPTNNCFCATESDIDLRTIVHPLPPSPPMSYWFQYCDLHEARKPAVSKTCRRMH